MNMKICPNYNDIQIDVYFAILLVYNVIAEENIY